MSRFAAAVHLTNSNYERVFFLKGEEIPEWAYPLIGDHLIGEDVKATPKVVKVETEEEVVAKLQARAAVKAKLEADAAEAAKADGGEETKSEEVDEDEDSEDEDAEGYAGWTNQALRDELIARSLVTTGKKAELVARLEEDDA